MRGARFLEAGRFKIKNLSVVPLSFWLGRGRPLGLGCVFVMILRWADKCAVDSVVFGLQAELNEEVE